MSNKDMLSLVAYKKQLAEECPAIATAFDFEEHCAEFLRRERLRLKFLGEVKGISQGDLANRLGLTQSAISRIERGKGDIGLSTVYRYTMALGLCPDINYVPSPSVGATKEETEATQGYGKAFDCTADGP